VGEALYYKEKEKVLYLRAHGHVTAALCADLRARAFDRFQGEPPVQGMYVDLSECEYMDSTFMGLLVGFNKRLLKSAGKRIVLVRPSESCVGLLTGLGIASLITMTNDEVPFPEDLENVVRTQATSAELLLKAHENLMELSDENRQRFSTLHKVLSGQTGEEGSIGSGR